MGKLMIGWTTVGCSEGAEKLAKSLIGERLAACVQIDGPVHSHYRWEGEIHCEPEYRLMIKFLATREKQIVEWLKTNHPYSTPEWVVVEATTLPAYLNWAIETTMD